MRIDLSLPQICLAIAITCLVAGYLAGGYWLIVPTMIILLILWRLTKPSLTFWSVSTLLLSYIFLAVIGIVLNLSVYLMVFGCTSMLTYWDLMNFRSDQVNNSRLVPNALLEKYHLQSLGTASLLGIVAMLISANLKGQFSFGMTAALVLISMIGLTYGVYYVSKRHR